MSTRSFTRQAVDLLAALSLGSCGIVALVWVLLANTLRPSDVGMPISWNLLGRSDFALIAGRRHVGLMQRSQAVPVVWAPAGATRAQEAQWSLQFGQSGEGEILGFAGGGRVQLSRSTTGRMYYSGWERWAAAPYWAPFLLTATPPALWLARLWRRRRSRLPAGGRCPACGYDLRATPGRCPECGQVASRVAG